LKEIINRALNLFQLRKVQYADVRLVHNLTELMVVKNGVVEAPNFSQSTGFGVRTLVNGAWGFASSHELSTREVERIVDQAISIAQASARAHGDKVDLGPAVASQGTYQTPIQIDPFLLSPEEKLAELLRTKMVRQYRGSFHRANHL
jgi:TldD protein